MEDQWVQELFSSYFNSWIVTLCHMERYQNRREEAFCQEMEKDLGSSWHPQQPGPKLGILPPVPQTRIIETIGRLFRITKVVIHIGNMGRSVSSIKVRFNTYPCSGICKKVEGRTSAIHKPTVEDG